MKNFAFRLCALVVVGCGADVVIDDPGAGGSGSTSGASATVTSSATGPTSTATSSSTGTTVCDSHDDCSPGVCYFPTGQCVPACEPGTCNSCGPGSFCEPCAIGSCPACADCVAACVPIDDSRCDDDDPCPLDGTACYFPSGVCLPVCSDVGPNGGCGDFSFCQQCATGTCCGCENCVDLCMGGE